MHRSTVPRSATVSAVGTPHPLSGLGIVLVAAGRGERLGAGIPKAYTELAGATLLEHCLMAISALPTSGHLVIVVPDGRGSETLRLVEQVLPPGHGWTVSAVTGGRERHESVRFGVAALHGRTTIVLVHDAARPLAPHELFLSVASEVARTGDAVVPALPVADTLKRIDAHSVVADTLDRTDLVAVQTPQGFPRELLEAAHGSVLATPDPGDSHPLPTDDAAVVERAGGRVRTVPGDPLAHKLTTQADLRVLEAFLAARGSGGDA